MISTSRFHRDAWTWQEESLSGPTFLVQNQCNGRLKELNMDDGEVEISDHAFPNPIDHEQTAVDTLIDEFLKNTRTCTHTHTCNPPGPDAAHTHTCHHTHTRVIASGDDNGLSEKQPSVSKTRKPSGNREAVRKYREKKKAHTAYLEEEVKKLHLTNQQLLRKLRGQALLEAEVLRLRALLLDVRGKIDAELGVFPFQKPCNGSGFKEGDCSLQSIDVGANLHCEMEIPCLHPKIGPSASLQGIGGSKMFGWERSCEPAIVNCRANPSEVMGQDAANTESHLDCMLPNAMDMMGSLVSSGSQDE